MAKCREITWLKDSVKINKLRIEEMYNCIEFGNPQRIMRDLIEKSRPSINSAKHSLSLSNSLIDSERLSKVTLLLEGLSNSLYSPDGRKMIHDYTLMTKNLIVEILDIACRAYERAIHENTFEDLAVSKISV